MVLRVKPTPTRFPTNSLYTPMDSTPLHSISSVCHPWGMLFVVVVIVVVVVVVVEADAQGSRERP